MALGSSGLGLGFGDAGGGGGGTVMGSGTLNYVPKWTPDGVTLGNSLIYDTGSAVVIGGTSATGKFDVLGGMTYLKGSDSTSGNFVLKADNSSGSPLLYVRNDGLISNDGVSFDFGLNLVGTTASEKATMQIYDSTLATNIFNVNASGTNYGVAIGTAWGTSGQTGLLHLYRATGPARFYLDTNDVTSYAQLNVGPSFAIQHYGSSAYAANQTVITKYGTGVLYIANRTSDIYFGDDLSYFDPRFIMTTTGAFGIGVSTSPTARLHVKGSDSTSSNFAFKADDSANVNIIKGRNDGYVIQRAINAAISDGSLSNNELSFYIDESGNTLTVKVKYSGGTVKTGTVALT